MSTDDAQVDSEGSILRVVEILLEIDVLSPDSRVNEQSISDGNGGRIVL